MSKIEKQNKYRQPNDKDRYPLDVELELRRRRASPKHIKLMRELSKMSKQYAD